MTHSTPEPHVRTSSAHPLSLWVGLLTGPIAWSIYFMGGYVVSEAACRTDFLSGRLLGFNGLTAALLLMTAAALLVIFYGGWTAYKNWQPLRSKGLSSKAFNQIDDYRSFMAVAGLMLSGLAALLTLVIGLSVPFLPMCS